MWDDPPVPENENEYRADSSSIPRSPIGGATPVAEGHEPRSGKAVLEGTTKSPKHDKEQWGQGVMRHTLSLILLTYDSRGSARPVSVQMKGLGIKGPDPTEGERIEVTGTWHRDGVFEATRIVNIDTKALTTVGGKSTKRLLWVVGTIVVIFIATVWVIVGFGLFGKVSGLLPWGNDPDAPSVVSTSVEGETPQQPQPGPPIVPQQPQLVFVPPISAGTPGRDAQDTLQQAGLVANIITESSNTYALDDVIRLDPTSGTQVAPGSQVDIYISSGPAITVPPIAAGSTSTAAASAIRSAGLNPIEIRQTDPNTPFDAVIYVDPPPGAAVNAGSDVFIYVSDGP